MSSRRDEELDAVLIGGRERVTITIADYDTAWPVRFERERDRIAAALSDGSVVRIEHIGSTAVPGLAAKPIVDILVTVPDPDDDAAFAPALEAAGYELRVREPCHRMFRTPERDVHVHVWADDDREVEHYLLLRDHLRNSPGDRAKYERLKRDLAARGGWEDMNHYADAKSELIEALIARGESLAMWHHKVENAKRGYAVVSDAVRSGDWDAFRRYVEERFDPEVVVKPAGVLPETEEMRGHDGAVRFFVTQTEAFDALRLEPQDFLEIPDRLVVTLRISGHARHSGIDVKFERTHVFTYRGDKVLRMEVYADRTEAFEAARAEIRPNHR